MPTPAFEWKEYEVPRHEDARGVTLLVAEAEPGAATVTVPLPDLGAFPTPRAKAEILLQSAAEVEHALMVQYLYAAYSLKATPRDVIDPALAQALNVTKAAAWPNVLLNTAREEMGHLMTVQNLLVLLGMAPNLEREDFPPHKDLYPFKLHLEPLTQRSLAKYVVAEAPSDAQGIDDIVALATESGGTTVNHVGVLYGLLGLVFTAAGQVGPGATGDPEWDAMVRQLSEAAFRQAPAEAWHLGDAEFHADSVAHQADPDDWQTAQLRVHRVADRAAAVQAIRDIGEQGEGPTGEGETSHFARFLGIFRGQAPAPAFPAPGGIVATRDVPTDPKIADITHPRTRRWAELADLRYALLLGFVEHYLVGLPGNRGVLTGWIFAEMRSRVGYIARELTAMPRAEGGAAGGPAAAIPFTLPAELHLPDDEAVRWALHRRRTEAAIAKVEEIRAADPGDDHDRYLGDLLASDQARLAVMASDDPSRPIPTSFARDILPLFRPVDQDHMTFRLDLWTYDEVKGEAESVLERLSVPPPPPPPPVRPMPPPPDMRWTKPQIELFKRWIAEDFPR